MKKINYLLIAAIASLTVASCQKEQAEQFTPAGQGAGQEFTVSLPEVTKTALVEGKTVWAKNDSLWVSNGTLTEKIGVPEESWGQKSFTFKTKGTMITPETPNMYMVYPFDAAAGVKDGKVSVKIKGVQDGQFKNANIAAAQTTTYAVSLKNVTAVLKVNIADDQSIPIHALSINGNNLAGTCTVDFSGDAPVLTPTSKGNSVAIMAEGLTGDFYAAVIPGTYEAGFSLTAATVDFEHACETKTTKSAKTVNVNELVNLGTIGKNLQPLNGAGTQAEPWQLENIGHMIAFAYAVNEGRTFEGEYLKVMNDIEGVTTPAGNFSFTYASSSGYKTSGIPFQGDFDGNNKTLTLDLNSSSVGRTNGIGLFGGIADGANVHDLVLAGKVSTSGNLTGALAGHVLSGEKGVKVTNVTNKAAVGGNNNIGGLIGQAAASVKDLLIVDNCKNEGSVTASSYAIGGIIGLCGHQAVNKTVSNCTNSGSVKGTYSVGGVVGYNYCTVHKNNENAASASVTGTADCGGFYGVVGGSLKFESNDYNRGVGGISGWGQNSSFTDCTNNGSVTGITKVGGINGCGYWCPVSKCTNKGSVSATGNHSLGSFSNFAAVGGIVGYQVTQGNISDCKNEGQVSGTGQVGGIVGRIDTGGTSGGYQIKVVNCENSTKVIGNQMCVGGIAGMASSMANNRYAIIEACKNTGEVVNASQQTGGIVGDLYDLNNSAMGRVQDCTNTGSVEGTIWSGGIIGYAQTRATKGAFYVRNCDNKGDVLTKRADADNGDVGGGIVGATNNASAGLGLQLFNCVNYGKVQYKEVSHVKPYLGGIVGRYQKGKMENVVNLGTVGPVTGEPAEGADQYLGAIAASVENDAAVNEAYYKKDSYIQAVGKATASAAGLGANIVAFNNDGLLDTVVTIAEQDASTVDDALNLWVEANKATYAYYKWGWSDGPVFVKE